MATELGWIDPTVGGNAPRIALAARPMDLAGKVVALLDNTKEQGQLILETIGNALRERYAVAGVVLKSKEHYSKPAIAALIDAMAREADVAVCAVGG